jgi:hypothetical protein
MGDHCGASRLRLRKRSGTEFLHSLRSPSDKNLSVVVPKYNVKSSPSLPAAQPDPPTVEVGNDVMRCRPITPHFQHLNLPATPATKGAWIHQRLMSVEERICLPRANAPYGIQTRDAAPEFQDFSLLPYKIPSWPTRRSGREDCVYPNPVWKHRKGDAREHLASPAGARC